jgi:hypothetical protein
MIRGILYVLSVPLNHVISLLIPLIECLTCRAANDVEIHPVYLVQSDIEAFNFRTKIAGEPRLENFQHDGAQVE